MLSHASGKVGKALEMSVVMRGILGLMSISWMRKVGKVIFGWSNKAVRLEASSTGRSSFHGESYLMGMVGWAL